MTDISGLLERLKNRTYTPEDLAVALELRIEIQGVLRPAEETVVTTVRLPASYVVDINRLAKEEGITQSKKIRDLLWEGLYG